MIDDRLNEEILMFSCERIDIISDEARQNEKYIELKNNTDKLFNELGKELAEPELKKLKKLLDFNFQKESCLEEILYKEGLKDGIRLERKFNE